MTDTNQKLREALQAISHIDDSTNHAVDASAALDRIGKIARQALALPTALAISDTWGISRALVTLYAYECDGATDKALALITADHIPDAGEMVADQAPNAGKMIETAAPVGERDAFEHDLSKSPFEFDMDRWPDNAPVDWPGSYKQYHVQCAWDAWKARAALRAGVAGERELFEQFAQNCPMGKYNVTRRGEGYDSSHTQIMWDAWQAGRAALRAGDPIYTAAQIDAATRKGPL